MNTPQGMKPFNLQEWQNGANPICRNGYEPTDLHYFEKASGRLKMIFTLQNECYCFNRIDGLISDNSTSNYDLFLKAEKKEGWINLYKVKGTKYAGVYDTEQEALLAKSDFDYLTTIKIEWNE